MVIDQSSVPIDLLPISSFKAHLRLASGFEEETLQDPVLIAYLSAAITAIEARINRIVLERDFVWTFSGEEANRTLSVPLRPVKFLKESVFETDGNDHVIGQNNVKLVRNPENATFCIGQSIPSSSLVRVVLRVGMVKTWDMMPADLAQAILLLAAHYYEFRHEVNLSSGCMPFGVTSLIDRYKLRRISLGGGA